MMYKTVFVQTTKQPIFKPKTVKQPSQKRNWLGFRKHDKVTEWQPTGQTSQTTIDGHQLAIEMKHHMDDMARSGYSLHSITPIQSGQIGQDYRLANWRQFNKSWFGYGFSITSGVVMVFAKDNERK